MSSAFAMFQRKPHGDIKKSAQKVCDPKKDTLTRLKHLRLILDQYEIQDAKIFFDTNYSHIYYIFYDNFVSVETDLKQRVNKAHKEELEGILQIFEKILLLLPELIHKRWMFHSIGRVLRKLLHPGNILKWRRDGMRLFIIWYQILQGNATDECHQMYLQLVPLPGKNDDLFASRIPMGSCDSSGGIVSAGEVTPILPATGEKQVDNVSKYFLENLLTFMVSEVVKVEWLNKEMIETSFVFLFDKFKTTYLLWLLPDFDYRRTIYDPYLDLPQPRRQQDTGPKDESSDVLQCTDSFIRWLSNFTISSKKQDGSVMKGGMSCSVLTEPSVASEQVKSSPENKPEHSDLIAGSTVSTLSTDSKTTDSNNSSVCSDDHPSEYEIVKSVLYSTRENVNIVHECFRQALLFSFKHAGAMRRVIAVYKEWFQHDEERPRFLEQPPEPLSILTPRDTPELFHSSLSDIVEEASSDECVTPELSVSRPSSLLDTSDKSKLRNASYLGAIQDLADRGEYREYDVRAGLQRVLQIFITNAANIFLLETEEDGSLQEQVDLCKRVLNIYRHVVMNIHMEQKTWEQMLMVLLCITSNVLKPKPPSNRHKDLGGRLAQPIFQTLIVTWIKANLNVFISMELWDKFLQVLSSLTAWAELIKEWAKTMETLTRVLARQVYGLDLQDLPLQRLSEQKEKRKRGKSQEHTRTKATDRSFSKSWGASEGQSGQPSRPSGGALSNAIHDTPFERGKYKSDGAGSGNKMLKTDLSKQRPLSGEPTPAHSRNASSSSDIMVIVRSSSEGNIADPMELAEKLRGEMLTDINKGTPPACPQNSPVAPEAVGASAPLENEDCEVAAITTTCTAELISLGSGEDSISVNDSLVYTSPDNVSLEKSDEKSDSENISRLSRTPSPSHGSRSPTPSSEMVAEIQSHHKDSPTPDRDSLHIDMVAGTEEAIVCKESLEEFKSVLAGGPVVGWTPDVAVVLWKRMLGILGDVNKIEDPDIHATVFDYLCDLLDTMFQIRDNSGITQDNTNTPPPPDFIPPLFIFSPWLFECLNESSKYKKGKLLAYQMICQLLVRIHDIPVDKEVLIQFNRILHDGLVSDDQDVINVLVKFCGPRYFTVPLTGSTVLLLDFIHAAGTIISSVNIQETHRAEAMSLLGSLVCFPNHFGDTPVLQPNSIHMSALNSNDAKDHIIGSLLKAGKREPAGLARCIAISSIAVFLYEEITHGTLHPKIKEGINVLLAALRCINKAVAKVASDMLTLLCDHVDKLLNYHPDLPKRIIEMIASTLSTMIPCQESVSSDEEKRLIVSMMFCMVEWCMKMPMYLMLETSDTERSCLYKVNRVLKYAVTGRVSNSLQRASQPLSDLVIPSSEFDGIKELQTSNDSPKHSDTLFHGRRPSRADNCRKIENDSVKLAARTLMTHLVNHFGHFPMGAGAARINSTTQEHHDLTDYAEDDLKPEIFSASNVQFFILNQNALISFIELPAILDVPGGGVTAGLTTAKTVCRIIIRDLNGKVSWENSILYGPPWCKKGSSYESASLLLSQDSSTQELEPLIIQEDSDVKISSISPQRPPSELPNYDTTRADQDNLHDLLRYVGHISPECHLHPGQPLNIPGRIPSILNQDTESEILEMVLKHKESELDYYSKHKKDFSLMAQPQMPEENQDPTSPFQMCRMMLDQLGLLSWEKRCHFDSLNKTDKLLREIKHLDNQKCRETHKIAVIYVGAGQEDKASILSNSGGSKAYEEFVAGLGWEVDLENHQGFLGGLQQNKTTGDTAPYYSNSTCEVIFHVSTRMPSGSDECSHIKMRHLGNDEVHIIWSEHNRDYRRGIISTDFGDVLIVIYPLHHNNLYRVQINRKSEVPYFGPLFDGAILDHMVLPGLVRATAINASRVKRSLIQFYHSHYEERAKCLDTITQQHIQQTMFEDFAANVFAPVLPADSAIVDSPMQQEPTPPLTSSSSVDMLSLQGQISPQSSRSTRASESVLYEITKESTDSLLGRTAKRLSMKNRKSTSSKMVHSASFPTPPESPPRYKK